MLALGGYCVELRSGYVGTSFYLGPKPCPPTSSYRKSTSRSSSTTLRDELAALVREQVQAVLADHGHKDAQPAQVPSMPAPPQHIAG